VALRVRGVNRCTATFGCVRYCKVMVSITVKKLFILLFMGFFVGNAFAEARLDIKVSDTADSHSARVAEILVNRGEWVQSDQVVAVLTVEEKDLYVRSPDTGVVMKVLAAQGDSVSRGTALVQLKKVSTRRPDFELAWGLFSFMNVSVPSVGKRLGGKVKHNIEISEKEDGKWKNACTIRMSFVLNHSGFPIKSGKYPTVSGIRERQYIYRTDDMISHLRDLFGTPDIVINRVPNPNDFYGMKGILVVTGDGRGDARGHVTLWNGSECADTCHLAGDENNRTFKPLKATLWVLP